MPPAYLSTQSTASRAASVACGPSDTIEPPWLLTQPIFTGGLLDRPRRPCRTRSRRSSRGCPAPLPAAALGPEGLAVDVRVRRPTRSVVLVAEPPDSAGRVPSRTSPTRTLPALRHPDTPGPTAAGGFQQMTPSCERLSPSLSGSRRAGSAPRDTASHPRRSDGRVRHSPRRTDRQATEPPSNPTPTGMSSRPAYGSTAGAVDTRMREPSTDDRTSHIRPRGAHARLSDTDRRAALEAIVAGRFREGDILPPSVSSATSSASRAP